MLSCKYIRLIVLWSCFLGGILPLMAQKAKKTFKHTEKFTTVDNEEILLQIR